MPIPEIHPQWYAVIVAALVVLGVLAAVGRRRRWSLANGLTWLSAVGTVVMAGTAIYRIVYDITSSTTLALLGVFLLEVPMVAFALRAKEAQAAGADWRPSLRKTWLLAGASAALSAVAAIPDGPAGVILRAITPLIGAMLWHNALSVAHEQDGGELAKGRWKWTPERILTHVGLYTAKDLDVEGAEMHRRLTKVADAAIAYERARAVLSRVHPPEDAQFRHERAAGRLDKVFRAAERDLHLSVRPDRMERLTAMIAARTAAYRLAEHARLDRPDTAASTDPNAAPNEAPNTGLDAGANAPSNTDPNAVPNTPPAPAFKAPNDGANDGANTVVGGGANTPAGQAVLRVFDGDAAQAARFSDLLRSNWGLNDDQIEDMFARHDADRVRWADRVPSRGQSDREFADLLAHAALLGVARPDTLPIMPSNGFGPAPSGPANSTSNSAPNAAPSTVPNTAPNTDPNDEGVLSKQTCMSMIAAWWEDGQQPSLRAMATRLGRSASTVSGYVNELRAQGHTPQAARPDTDPYADPSAYYPDGDDADTDLIAAIR